MSAKLLRTFAHHRHLNTMAILGLKSKGPSNPAHFDIERIVRPNILALTPYRCARDDYSAGVLLDANENAYGPSIAIDEQKDTPAASTLASMSAADIAQLNRYPSPTHDELKQAIAKLRGLPNEDWVFLGVGSDEVIDMLFRCLCIPAKDKVMVTPPSYGMYGVTAQVNDVGIVKVPLDEDFQLDEAGMDAAFADDIKILFICSPGNPTSTLIPLDAIRRIAENPRFKGLIVVDEAYIDFAPEGSSAVQLVQEYANVCVSQTLSKSFGLAAIRLGYLMGSPELIQVLTNAKAPYNVSLPTASLALASVSESGLKVWEKNTKQLNANRDQLIADLKTVPNIGRIRGGNHANFILAEVLTDGKPDSKRAFDVYKNMAENQGVVIRYRGSDHGCEGCVRITVGTEDECKQAVEKLRGLLA